MESARHKVNKRSGELTPAQRKRMMLAQKKIEKAEADGEKTAEKMLAQLGKQDERKEKRKQKAKEAYERKLAKIG